MPRRPTAPLAVACLGGAGLTLGTVGCAGAPGGDTVVVPDVRTDGSSPVDETANGGADRSPDEISERYPDVVAVAADHGDDGSWTFTVTISSPYDSPERYADGWRVVGPDGTVYGEHALTHDHAGEQPFTRTQRGVSIPDDVAEVTIEGRDQQYGYGGGTVTVGLDRSNGS